MLPLSLGRRGGAPAVGQEIAYRGVLPAVLGAPAGSSDGGMGTGCWEVQEDGVALVREHDSPPFLRGGWGFGDGLLHWRPPEGSGGSAARWPSSERVGVGVPVGRVSGSGRPPLAMRRSVAGFGRFAAPSSSSPHRERRPSPAPRLSRASGRKRREASRSDTGGASRPPHEFAISKSWRPVCFAPTGAQWKRAFRRRSAPSYAHVRWPSPRSARIVA